MKLFGKCLVLGLAASFASVVLFADVAPGEFNITGDGWPTFQSFTAHANSEASPNPTLDSLCFGVCFSDAAFVPSSNDPTLKVDLGGLSPAVGLDFGFSANGGGFVAQDFLNTSGQTFTRLEIIASGDSIDPVLNDYTCGPNTAFATCIVQVDPTLDTRVTFFLSGPPGIPSSTVPEPSTWVLLLTSGAVMAVGRVRKRLLPRG